MTFERSARESVDRGGVAEDEFIEIDGNHTVEIGALFAFCSRLVVNVFNQLGSVDGNGRAVEGVAIVEIEGELAGNVVLLVLAEHIGEDRKQLLETGCTRAGDLIRKVGRQKLFQSVDNGSDILVNLGAAYDLENAEQSAAGKAGNGILEVEIENVLDSAVTEGIDLAGGAEQYAGDGAGQRFNYSDYTAVLG